MYYYAKFANQDVSIVIGNRLKNFIHGKDGKPEMNLDDYFLSEIKRRQFSSLLPPVPHQTNYCCDKQENRFKCNDMPYMSYVHFKGKEKPWQNGLNHANKKSNGYGEARVWFDELNELNNKFVIGLDIENWMDNHGEKMKESPFGYLAEYADHASLVKHHNLNLIKTNTTKVEDP